MRPDQLRDVLRGWGRGKPEAELHDEVQSLLALPDTDVGVLASQAILARAIGMPSSWQGQVSTSLFSHPEPRLDDTPFLTQRLDRLANRRPRSTSGFRGLEWLTTSIGLEMVLIPAGRCSLGLYEVEIPRPFYLGVYPVTQEQYQEVMGVNPSWFAATGRGKDQVEGVDTARFPVESVSWEDAVAFCEKLSERPEEKIAERAYRLPTEVEWEYACSGVGEADMIGSAQCTRDVHEGQANAFGVVGSQCNVWEWCAGLYTALPVMGDAPAKAVGACRVLRGRSWSTFGARPEGPSRRPGRPGLRSNGVGFRIALTA
jgi:formylglycine-generating enzyme required for sulfatase activity